MYAHQNYSLNYNCKSISNTSSCCSPLRTSISTSAANLEIAVFDDEDPPVVDEHADDLVDDGVSITDCVLLKPFEHQVGGHSAVMKYDERSVCKPSNPTELQFYKAIPEALRDFVPKFRGQVDVYLEEKEDGILTMKACPEGAKKKNGGCIVNGVSDDWDSDGDARENERRSSSSSSLSSSSSTSLPSRRQIGNSRCDKGHSTSRSNRRSRRGSTTSSQRSSSSSSWCAACKKEERKSACCWVRVRNSGNLCIDVNSDEEDSELFEDQSDPSRSVSGVRRAGCNPWSMYCQLQQLAKMRRPENASSCYKFMVLENCTRHYYFPCILDLKIGTRSYADHVTDEKRRVHVTKAAATTTATVGVRAAGMQVFHADRGSFVCRNKYYGRRLTEHGLKEALCKFLYNGHTFRFELIPSLCRKLHRLIEIILRLPHYRFYGSSLLLIYEGLQMNFSSISESSSSDDDELRSSSGNIAERDANTRTTEKCPSTRKRESSAHMDYHVTLKVIDFASVSYAESNEGPDKGYIYGLQNLLHILRAIEATGKDGISCKNGCIHLASSCSKSCPV